MSTELIIILFIILGFASGILGGLLGVGGGVITVPALYAIFLFSDMLPDRLMQVAVGTSLACAIITSAVATYAQYRKKAIHFSSIRYLAPGLIFGCILGAILAHILSSAFLELTFGVIAILLGIYFFFPRLPHPNFAPAPNKSLGLFGIVIGTLSSMLGIGGGSMVFPVLLGYQLPAKNASATSSLATLISTIIATITYLIIAWRQPELSKTFGYIELPAFFTVSLGSILTTPIGVHLAHTLNVTQIKRIFGCSLILIGISMFVL